MTATTPNRQTFSLGSLISWSAHPTRSLIIFGVGAALGLLVAGFGLFTAKGGQTRIVPPEDVALVNQRPILLSDFNNQLVAQYATPLEQITPAERRAVLNDMIREELFVQRGLELDMPSSDPDVRSALVASVEQQVLADATAQKLTEDQLRTYFEAHRDHYATEGSMALVDLVATIHGRSADQALAAARAAAAALAQGQAPDPVAARYGLAPSGAVKGEEFYFAAHIHLGDDLFKAARALADGRVSAPIPRPDGTHVILMLRNRPPVSQSFAQAEPQVQLDYEKDLRARMAAAELKFLREKADILVGPAYR